MHLNLVYDALATYSIQAAAERKAAASDQQIQAGKLNIFQDC